MNFNHPVLLVPVLLLLLSAREPVQADSLSVQTQGGTELTLQRYPATGKHLLIWIAAGHGLSEREGRLAGDLAEQGIEVWQIDFAETLFQPHSNQLLRELNPDYVADLITAANQQTGKTILLGTHSYGAIPVLNGIQRWQSRRQHAAYLAGAILFTPELYTGAPALGKLPEYVPVVAATRIPIFIYQEPRHPTGLQLPRLLDMLDQNGAPVYIKHLAGVHGLFYTTDDTPETDGALFELPGEIHRNLKLLTQARVPLQAIPLAKKSAVTERGLDSKLVPFRGNPLPPPLDARDITGKHYLRQDYRGKVTIVNFWATWCPPCVEEIPSLNRLRTAMQADRFELISINFAEDPQHIREFMQQVNVEFPVLLDADGNTARQWNVFVFPSTFVIGPDGKIIYGVNAAITWDSPEVVSRLRKLIKGR